MAGPYTANSFNIGRDMSFSIVVNGQAFNFLGLVTDYNRKALSHLHEVIPANNDGIPVRRVTFSGYEYEMHLTRQDATVDLLVDALEQNYFQGSAPPVVSATETIRNPNQSVDQWQLTGGTILPESLGSFKGADPVNDVSLRVVFSQRNYVGGNPTNAVNLKAATSYL